MDIGLTIASAEETSQKTTSKNIYVLVHGAWAGGWEWKKLGEALRKDGQEVYRPTLTGQGERVHLATPNVDLNMHIQDIVNLILWDDLHDIVLVGHSYGGMVITGVADQVPGRIKHIIYVDAFLPEDGESVFSSMPDRPRPQIKDGYFALGDFDNKPIPHVVPQSEKTFSQPISLHHQDVARKLPTTYILTVDKDKESATDGFFRFYERARARGWKTQIMEGDHVVHINQTAALAHLIEAAP